MPSRPRLLATAIVAASLLAPVERIDAAKRKNGIIFEIETNQRIAGGSPTSRAARARGRNFARLEVEVLRTCVGDVDSHAERVPVILQGHTKGNYRCV
jgi:hypothetical protein